MALVERLAPTAGILVEVGDSQACSVTRAALT